VSSERSEASRGLTAHRQLQTANAVKRQTPLKGQPLS
jgi:hypothetical protein